MIYLLYLLIVTVLLFFLYYRWQYATLFHPKLYREVPFDERFRFLSVTTEDGVKLEGCVYEPVKYKETLLYFGGRGQDSVGLLPKLSECYSDFRIITFNYRGYGKSEGTANEQNMMQDALAVYEKVVKNFGEVTVMGYSLGCSVASLVVAKKSAKKLFLIAPFSSLRSLVKDIYGFALPMLRFRFDTCANLQKIENDVYIFVSKNDNVVPYKNSKRLYECIGDTSNIVELEGLTHVEVLCDERVVDFITAHSSISTPSQNSS